MKRYRGWIFLVLILAFFGGAVWSVLRITAEYPTLGEPVSYPVDQIGGVELTIKEPSWSLFRGYTIQYKLSADSKEVYYLLQDGEGHGLEYLERLMDGQWYRLGYIQEKVPLTTVEFALGGEESSGLEGSLVQKYACYGTRLEFGIYRVVLEMRAEDGTPHYVASEFEVS